jgi:hypothetical protein
MFQAVLHAFLAATIYGLFGASLGVLLRSPGLSIGIGIAWVIPIEAIIVGAIWSNGPVNCSTRSPTVATATRPTPTRC